MQRCAVLLSLQRLLGMHRCAVVPDLICLHLLLPQPDNAAHCRGLVQGGVHFLKNELVCSAPCLQHGAGDCCPAM